MKRTSVTGLIMAALLTGCLNEGGFEDKHAITFEQNLPNNVPSNTKFDAAYKAWLSSRAHDPDAVKDISSGPVRYAKLVFPYVDVDFFTCSKFQGKNEFGTYMPTTKLLVLYRDYGKGLSVGLIKVPGEGQYDQYCSGANHG